MYNLPQKYPIIRCINSTVNKQVCDLSYALNRTLKCKFSITISINYNVAPVTLKERRISFAIGDFVTIDYIKVFCNASPYRRIPKFRPCLQSLVPLFPPTLCLRTRRSFPWKDPWLKVYIAYCQTFPNCSSSCYANGHILL